jgi:predicted ester cyclase
MKQKIVFLSFFALMFMQSIFTKEVLPEPKSVILAKGETLENKSNEILAARRYAAFWNTGDARYAELALAPDFMDRTLPEGRQQGPLGPIEASKAFRSAVPDLKVEIEKIIVADDYVVVNYVFNGHFTGIFNSVKGEGQKVNFIAIDIYRIKNGKITDNWHLEDNLKFLHQIGVVK